MKLRWHIAFLASSCSSMWDWCTCMQLANNIPQLGLSFPVACASLSGQQKQAPACRVLGNTVALDCAFPSPNTSLCWQQGKCQSLLQWNALTAAGSNVGSLAFWAFSSYKVKSYRYDPATKFKDSCYQNAGFGWSRWNAQQRWNIYLPCTSLCSPLWDSDIIPVSSPAS